MKDSTFLSRAYASFVPGAALVCLLLFTPLRASGNPVPGHWQKVVALEPGTRITVITADDAKLECRYEAILDASKSAIQKDDYRLAGHRIWVGRTEDSRAGVFVSLTEDGYLRCQPDNGKKREIRLVAVKEIILPRTGEYARDWAAWGAVGGTVGGILLSTAFDDLSPEKRLLVGGAGAVLGALGGGLTGASVGSKGEIIYISKEAASRAAGN